MLRLLTAATLWWGLASVLVSGVEQQDLDLQDEAVFLQTAEAAVPGGYVKHGKVPVHLDVSRKLVTASWVKCKLACDSDKGCQGFKFTPMANNHLPLCELLGAQKGSFMKRSFRAKERVSKKMQRASELVGKAKKVEEKAAKAAIAAHKKMKQQKRKSVVIAARQQTVKAELRLTQASVNDAKRKRKLINAKLLRAKLEVKEIEGKKLGKFSKQELKLEKKMRAKEIKKEKKVMKKEKKVVKRTVQRKKAQMLRKTIRAIKRDNKGIDAEKEQNKAARKEIATKRSGIKKKLGLIKRLAAVDSEVMSLRKKVVGAQLALKYATEPERLKLLKEKIRNKIKAEQNALKAANHKKRKYEQKAKRKKAELIASKAMAAKRAAKKQKLQKGEAVEKKKISSLEKKASERKKKMKQMEEKRRKADKKAEIKAKHSAMVARIAAAKDSNGLRELDSKMTAKKKILETDVWRLKLTGRLDNMNKAALLKFYTHLGQKEEKLRAGLTLLKTTYKKNEVLDGNYKALFRRINKSTSTVWLKVKTHSLTGRVAQLQHDILSEKEYGATLQKIQALNDVKSGAALLKQLDERKQASLAAIAQLKVELKSPAKKLALYRHLKDEEKALKGEGATAMRKRIDSKKAQLARAIIKAQVKQAKKVAIKQVKHDNKLAKYKEFVQKDSIKRAGEGQLQKKLLWQDERISTLKKEIKTLRSGKLLARKINPSKKGRKSKGRKSKGRKSKRRKSKGKKKEARKMKKKASKLKKKAGKAKKQLNKAVALRKKARAELRKQGKPIPKSLRKGGMAKTTNRVKKAKKVAKKVKKKAKKKLKKAKKKAKKKRL